jgi:hypothetical protein
MKYFTPFVVLTFLFVPLFVHADEVGNAGFLPTNIWYSKDPFFAEDKIRVYTILFNGSAYDITGTVEFYDNGLAIGETSFSISGNGRVQDLWVDWIAKEGKHTITARITDASVKESSGKKRAIILENTETGKSERDIDIDTDGDNIGNSLDTDDDNDTVSDVEEIKEGADPLKKDTDGDGISDVKEIEDAKRVRQEAEEATSTGVLGEALDTIKTISDTIPDPVKTGVSSGTNFIEKFRLSEGYQFKLEKEAMIKEVALLKVREAEFLKSPEKKEVQDTGEAVLSTAEKPLTYVLIALYAVLQYLFEWKILFYGLILYGLYRVLRFAIKRFQER